MDLADFYGIENWKDRIIGFEPTKHLASGTGHEDYTKNEVHLFKLKRGYALVWESGCSCYESGDAQIDLFPTLKAAEAVLRKPGDWSQKDAAKKLLQNLR